jgi:hypothetical protein
LLIGPTKTPYYYITFAFLGNIYKGKCGEIHCGVMKKLCSECKARFEVPIDDMEEGDAIPCPECNLEYTIVADKKGNLKLIESKTFEMEEEEEDSEENSDAEEDYDSD